jgi:hypothetical protein
VQSTLPDRLYSHVQRLEQKAVIDWCKEHHPDLEQSDVLAQHVRAIETTLTRLRGGNITVAVQVHAKKDSDSTQAFHRLQAAANRLYTLESSA